ncbi:MAG TPA: ATP-binding protein [Stellaceae bacterium]|nr:ATP-binding protein [Stellaceae bacterium]
MSKLRGAMSAFLHSPEGNGWIGILLFSAALSFVAAYGFYQVSVRSFVANKTDEKATAEQLVDSFVTTYSTIRGQDGMAAAPVPSTFRAHAIDQFNKHRDSENALRLSFIGREGKAITTPPTDANMAEIIESFVGGTAPQPVAQLLTLDGQPVFRTVYPSLANDRSCVDCHNKLQPGANWKLGDVMGAFVLDAPVGPFFASLKWECLSIAVIVFALIGGVGLWMSVEYYRGIRERERARDAAEAANRAKSDFLANMSHELRTPLNAIIGFSEMMKQEVLGAVGNEQYRSYVTDIHASGTHLLQIINDILDLSKAEAGKIDLSEDVFDLRDIMRSVRQLTVGRVNAASLTLTIELADNLPPISGDERKTKQVLLNLITNSVKFTPAGGALTVTARWDVAQGVAITVADTGVGIPEEDLERVLKPFEQVDSSLSRQHQGTGLGLPLVKAIMEMHGGRFELSSELGVGTRATVIFPPQRVLAPCPIEEGSTRDAA